MLREMGCITSVAHPRSLYTIAARIIANNPKELFFHNLLLQNTRESLYKANAFACSLANRDTPVATTLQRLSSGGIILVVVTQIALPSPMGIKNWQEF